MRLATAMVLGALLAGCLASEPSDGGEPSQISPPVEGAGSTAALVFTGCSGRCEPNVAVDLTGRVFVAAYRGTQVAVSEDGGQSFKVLPGPEMPSNAPPGARHNDGLVQTAPDGALYFSSFVPSDRDPGSMFVARSEDGARSWHSVLLAVDLADPSAGITAVPDRQWLGFGADGAIYASYTLVPGGSFVARSDDGGRSFGPFVPASTVAERANFGQASPVVELPSGRLAMAALARATPTAPLQAGLAGVRLSLSDDGGVTWRGVDLHAVAPPTSAGFQFPMLAAMDGALHVAWVSKAGRLHVLTSADEGETWSDPVAWSLPEESVPTAAWPAVVGNTLHLVYYTVDATLSLVVASSPADEADPVIVASGIPPGSGAVAAGVPDPRMAARTDFASAAPMPDGRLAVTWVDADGNVYVETL